MYYLYYYIKNRRIWFIPLRIFSISYYFVRSLTCKSIQNNNVYHGSRCSIMLIIFRTKISIFDQGWCEIDYICITQIFDNPRTRAWFSFISRGSCNVDKSDILRVVYRITDQCYDGEYVTEPAHWILPSLDKPRSVSYENSKCRDELINSDDS